MPTEVKGRVAAILSVLILAIWAIFPGMFSGDFKSNLRPGIDMVGGTSLLYEIQAPEGADTSNLVDQVMAALKKRVDPDGTRNLIWRPQGNRRLEIQMPLTDEANRAAEVRQQYAQAQTALENTNVRTSTVLSALRADPTTDAASLAGDNPLRADLFAQIKDAFNALQEAEAAEDAQAAATAELKLDELSQAVPATNLRPDELRLILDGDPELLDEKLENIRADAADFPSRLTAIDQYVDAYNEFKLVRDSIDDSASLKQLLRGSGVLSFHIVANDMPPAEYQGWVQRLQERGPRAAAGDIARWYEVAEENAEGLGTTLFNGKQYILVYTDPQRSMINAPGRPDWSLASAQEQFNGSERVAGFKFDAIGAQLFGDLTRTYKPQGAQRWQIGIVLDDELISAPNINGPILGGQGIIEGGGQAGFDPDELAYLVTTLNAGSLPAQLTDDPIVERTIGPSLGADNLWRGLMVCIVGVIIVAVFLTSYYYLSGVVATCAVLMNLLLILGSMAALPGATFTLPSVAGIVLSIGMAVDANVLIFERLREEQQRGLSIRQAIANAYDRAWSAIIDSNVTTLITAAILYAFGSEEVKGFGLTLMIGTVVSLFTALYVTKTVFAILVNNFGIEKLGSIPLSLPWWDDFLKPDIDWMRKIWILTIPSFATIFIGLGLFGYYWTQDRMLDIEFSSGTAVQFTLNEPMEIEDVRTLVGDESFEEVLEAVNVQSVDQPGIEDGKVYELVTVNQDSNQVRDAVMNVFGEKLELQLPSNFTGSDRSFAEVEGTLVQPIESGQTTIDDFDVPDLAGFGGGAAVLLTDLDPPLPVDEIKSRIEQKRLQPDAGKAANLTGIDVLPVAGTGGTTAVVVMFDPNFAYNPDNPAVIADFAENIAAPLWDVTRSAISDPAELDKVTNFDPSVASDFRNDAIVAVILSLIVIVAYIWLRFGNLKYGAATIIALLHDVCFVFAGIGVAHMLAETFIGDLLLLEAFRINLTTVAAVLTVMGFSMNDTVVVFDRIRENRDKVGHVDAKVVNNSINQTLSRTLLTGGTTMVTIFVMFVFGGPGIHAFTFAMLIGIVVGTYSSIAIASPILLLGGAPKDERVYRGEGGGKLDVGVPTDIVNPAS
ncbi:MAG: protein translocase subunit SecD [Planctomycetota bacterium]